ncbi:hypothetical protein IAD21_02699 [Abditibacteriota bacterium]|nr:hypothetical protein IAD21_02699 [Abditibacteriota bacterium]
MKWVFALNAESVERYGDFARVAVVSAKRHSSLDAVCLFDGEEDEFTRWLQAQGVEVLHVRSRFYNDIQAVANARNGAGCARIATGAFLRLEIPRIAREYDWKDEFVFYTDCDVIFERDPYPLLETLRPHLFAATPETFKNKPLHMNTGAMWMNIKALEDPELDAWTRANMEKCLNFHFDQAVFRVFYNPLHRLAWRLGIPNSLFYGLMSRVPLHSWKWDDLPLELNWKPYWGPNLHACVIHFHGLKPTQRFELERKTLPSFISTMQTPFFDECATKWDDWLEKARTA